MFFSVFLESGGHNLPGQCGALYGKTPEVLFTEVSEIHLVKGEGCRCPVCCCERASGCTNVCHWCPEKTFGELHTQTQGYEKAKPVGMPFHRISPMAKRSTSCKIGWTTYNSWLAFWQVLKDFTDQKRDEKMYKKVPIFRIMYQRQLLLTSSLLMVLYTEISELFVHLFVQLLACQLAPVNLVYHLKQSTSHPAGPRLIGQITFTRAASRGRAPEASYDKRRHRNCFQTRPMRAFPKK